MISAKVESMISVGLPLPSRRLQGIWARERTGGTKGTLASRVSYTIPRRLDFRIPGHMLKKSKIPSTANRDKFRYIMVKTTFLVMAQRQTRRFY